MLVSTGRKRILLHSCCGPCSTVVVERLLDQWQPVMFFYGPNIQPEQEYLRRLEAARKVAAEMGVPLVEAEYDPEEWNRAVGHLAQLPEGSERCRECFRLRMMRTAVEAARLCFDAFSATLSVSRHKSSRMVIDVGRQVQQLTAVPFLDTDFKKRGGYERSVELSRRFGLYRQDYCGCLPSLREAEQRRSRRRNGDARQRRG